MKSIAALVFASATLWSSVAAGRSLIFNGATEADFATTNRTADSGGAYWDADDENYFCHQAGLIYLTNNVPWCLLFAFGGTGAGTIFRIEGPSGALYAPYFRVGEDANEKAFFEICPGGWFKGRIYAGNKGYGVVTNNGAWVQSDEVYLGMNSGSHGVIVQNGIVTNENAKELYVGMKGLGELFINKPTKWSYYRHGAGDIIVGQSSATNRIVIGPEGSFGASYIYFGGRVAGQAGHGELQMRGGTYINMQYNGDLRDDLFSLGACTNETGAIDTASYGAIRGWGSMAPYNDSYSRYCGIYVRLGYGEIVGDGEGDETQILTFSNVVYQVTNVLFGVTTESGWRAINKGAVELVRSGGPVAAGTSDFSRCVGCSRDLETPDLVNAVRISCQGLSTDYMKAAAARLLAPDRTDAHTNALPDRVCSVLSVHRLGVFTGWTSEDADRLEVPSYKVAIRYDQTKILRDDSRLDLLRYTDASGKWTRVASIGPDERPDDCVISTDAWKSASDSADELYTMGTFAVVEVDPTGLLVIMR